MGRIPNTSILLSSKGFQLPIRAENENLMLMIKEQKNKNRVLISLYSGNVFCEINKSICTHIRILRVAYVIFQTVVQLIV